MNKVIRLTESDLHNMIKEAINELDWRTYASAAQKDKRGRNNKFKDAAQKSFNKKFNKGLDPNKYKLTMWDFDDISIHDYEETPSYKCHGTCGSYRGKTDSFYPSDPDTIRQSKPRQVLKNAAKELKDFNQGKTHYNPNTHAWENDDDFGPFSID